MKSLEPISILGKPFITTDLYPNSNLSLVINPHLDADEKNHDPPHLGEAHTAIALRLGLQQIGILCTVLPIFSIYLPPRVKYGRPKPMRTDYPNSSAAPMRRTFMPHWMTSMTGPYLELWIKMATKSG